jgi:hypothetical protein
MDLTTARDLRVMAEEYFSQAASIEQAERYNGSHTTMSRGGDTQQDNVAHQGRSEAHMQQRSQQRNGGGSPSQK